jgi:hypothetical protein
MEHGLSFDCENRPASTGGQKELFERERNGDPDFRGTPNIPKPEHYWTVTK